jgi:hypothetical protein
MAWSRHDAQQWCAESIKLKYAYDFKATAAWTFTNNFVYFFLGFIFDKLVT